MTGKREQKLLQGHKEEVVSLMFSPDGARIISGSFDFTCRVWDVFSGAEVFEALLGHTGVVWAVSFSPDGSQMASGSTDTTVRVWDAKTGELCDPNHPLITSGQWIIDLKTQRVLSRVPDIVQVQHGTGSKSSMALATDNGLVVMHFPQPMLTH
jgi:WD40 repeat protein